MSVLVGVVPPTSPDAVVVLRRYAEEIVPGNTGRAATEDDLRAFLAADPRSLVPPEGLFVVAREGDDLVGCAGLRLRGPEVPTGAGEIKRMWADPARRGRGIGALLLEHLTGLAGEAGLSRLVLDSRADLLAARALYARAGFVEVPAYNTNPDAEVWYAKELR